MSACGLGALRTSLQNPNDLDTIVTCRSQLPQRTVRLAVGGVCNGELQGRDAGLTMVPI